VRACVLNVVATDGGGIIDRKTGEGAFGTPALNYVYVTANDPSMTTSCPRCVASRCVGGQRAGLACSSRSRVA